MKNVESREIDRNNPEKAEKIATLSLKQYFRSVKIYLKTVECV